MATDQLKQHQHKPARTVTMATYLQSLAIAVLATGIVCFITSYFVTVSIYEGAHASSVRDLVSMSKAKQ